MTVAIEPIEVVISSPAQNGVYNFTFDWLGGSALEPFLWSSVGGVDDRILAHGDDWTATPSARASGGALTLLADPAGYDRLTIRRLSPLAQDFDAPPTASGFEAALDKVAMVQQELAAQKERRLKLPNALSGLVLPTAAAGQILGWDAAGKKLENKSPADAGEIGAALVTPTDGDTARTLADKLGDIVSVKDFGATGDGTTDDTAAINAAIASGARSIFFPSGTYRTTSTIVVSRSTCALVGVEGMDSIISADHNDTILRFSPSDPNHTGTLNGQGAENLLLVGPTQTGYALEVIKAERFNCKNLRWANVSNGILISGGQLNSFSCLKCTPPLVYVEGSAAIRTTPAATSGNAQQAYTINISDLLLSGGPSMRYDYIFDIGNSDGLNIFNGYVNFARTAIFNINPVSTQNCAAIQAVGLYMDGIFEEMIGVRLPSSTGSGSIGATFTNCFIGQFDSDAILISSTNTSNIAFDNCAIANNGARAANVNGGSNTNVKFIGCGIRNNTAGGIDVSTAQTVIAVGNTFNNNTGGGAIRLSGSISRIEHAGNTYISNSSNVTNIATVENDDLIASWASSGNFTPVLNFNGASTGVTYDVQIGYYTRIGDLVTVSVDILLTSKGTATGVATISLPFASRSYGPRSAAGIAVAGYEAGVTTPVARNFPGSASVTLGKYSGGSTVNLTNSDITNDARITLSMQYFV